MGPDRKIVLHIEPMRLRDWPWELWWRFVGWPREKRRMGWTRG